MVWSSGGASDVWCYGGLGCCNSKWSASAWWSVNVILFIYNELLIFSTLVGIYIYIYVLLYAVYGQSPSISASSWLILRNKYIEMHGQQNIKKKVSANF